jgi:DNA (cytosine-5)-methyltransferase 1
MEVKLALNHWGRAIETHSQNHPGALHDCTNISGSRPDRYPSTRVLWASPECTNHSQAQGTKYSEAGQIAAFEEQDPSSVRSRATMWDVVRFAEWHEYEYAVVENVPAAQQWSLWPAWLEAMKRLGYAHRTVHLNSMVAGVPQSRDRMYVVFWRSGNEAPRLDIRPESYCRECQRRVRGQRKWRDTELGRKQVGLQQGVQYTYSCPTCGSEVELRRAAGANVINWDREGERIGDRDRPLAESTIGRVKAGIDRHAGERAKGRRQQPWISVSDRVPSKARGFISYYYGSSNQTSSLFEPLGTVTTKDRMALVGMGQFCSDEETLRGGGVGEGEPRKGVPKKGVPKKDLPEGISPEDCTYRMLQPEEVKRAMGFPDEVVVSGTKSEKVRQCGNAVTPPVARLLLRRIREAMDKGRANEAVMERETAC